jgi:type II secretory pathway pseudopilin PulG
MKNIKAGFYLVEAMLTITLIAIAAVTALSFAVYCEHLAIQTDERMVAANFVRETVEDLYKRAYNAAGLSVTAGIYDPILGTSAVGCAFLSRYPTAKRNYAITDMGAYKLITVTVTWDQ